VLQNLRPWINSHLTRISFVVGCILEFLIINNFSQIPVTQFEEIIKTYTGLLSIIVLGIPTWIALDSNVKKTHEETRKVRQETSNLISQQELTVAQTLASYNTQLQNEIERNTQTFASMQAQINLRDNRIEQLSKELASETAAGKRRDDEIATLRTELATEREKGQTASAEIVRLKVYYDALIQKQALRIKRLEDYIRDNRLPLPVNGDQ
jgi:hypothetical protein